MEVKPALALPEGLEVTTIEVIDNVLIITAVATQDRPACPLCGIPALRVHSRYIRQVADLLCGATSPLAVTSAQVVNTRLQLTHVTFW